MSKLIQPIGRALNKVQRRFVRSRAGSVLILVVALLVLMALIGTAFMSMAQSDRASAALHHNNTEIDLLLDGVINLIRGATAGDVFVNGQFRPGSTYNFVTPVASTPYNYTTGMGSDPETAMAESNMNPPPALSVPVNPGDQWLASRTPELLSETVPPTTPNNYVLWRYISGPLAGNQFDSPYWPTAGVAQSFSRTIPSGSIGAGMPALFVPTFISLNGVPYPALHPIDRNLTPGPIGPPVLAADADGDGIADAGLFKLPIGPIDGVTYYAAVRIIDNSAAVNANIAWTAIDPTVLTPPQLPGDFFPSSIDFQSMITANDTTAQSFKALLNYRFNQQPTASPPSPTAPWAAYDDYSSNPSNPGLAQRTEINGSGQFATALEGEWMNFGRRLMNPGPTGASGLPFQAFSIGEQMNLAHNFVLRNPSVSTAATSPFLLEEALPSSLFTSALATSPYAPSDTLNWYQNNFYFYLDTVNGVNRMPIRSLLVTQNPVSNFAPGKFRDLGSWTTLPTTPVGGAYEFGDTVSYTYTDPISRTVQTHRFVCINPSEATSVPPVPTNAAFLVSKADYPAPSQSWALDNDAWVYEPWSTAPTKTSANTATFGQLWAAYWSVMGEQVKQITVTPPLNELGPVYPNPVSEPQPPTGGVLIPSPRMFRSPLRTAPPTAPSPTPVRLTEIQVMQLRAALAAVNTIDLRDSDDDVTSRTVHLIDNLNPNTYLTDVIATVYGLERQPFITQVYATNESVTPQTNGFVAVEVYNPYPQPIKMTNWAFATITRSDTVSPSVPPVLTPVLVQPSSPWDGTSTATTPLIPANGFAVFVSNPTPPNGITLPAWVQTATGTVPAVGIAPLYVVPNLVNALSGQGQELMLFRPRRDDGSPTNTVGGSTTPGSPSPVISSTVNANGMANYSDCAEFVGGQPNVPDMVPVDSYDFTGMLPKGSGPPTEWYYARPDLPLASPASKSWHFVYPGHYEFMNNPLGPPKNSTVVNPPRLIDGTIAKTVPTVGTLFATLPNYYYQITSSGPIQVAIAGGTLPFGALTSTPMQTDYKDVTVQLNNVDFGGPYGARVGAPGPGSLSFPYGGFARNGDLLQVPYIGSYRLAVPVPKSTQISILEMNPVTMDSVMALALAQKQWCEQPDTTSLPNTNTNLLVDPITDGLNTIENIGHFAPISWHDFTTTPTLNGYTLDDFQSETPLSTTPPINGPNPGWLYHWTNRLFDYLCVQSPQQDYMPDVDPGPSDPNPPATHNAKYAGQWTKPMTIPPLVTPTANVSTSTLNAEPGNSASSTEETVPMHGLININSAPWRVLATVPWLPPAATPAQTAQQRASIALSIVRYRDIDDGSGATPPHGHGPFRSIFELNNVPIVVSVPGAGLPSVYFRDLMGNALTSDFTLVQGNLSPANGAADNIFGDFESKFMMMNRVSNLITTRSDSYTAYILIQGWRNAETNHPELVVERRAAYIIDRSSVTPANKTPTMTKMPD